MQCELGVAKYQKTTEATQSVMSGDAEKPLLWICKAHADRLQKLPRGRVAREGDCTRCKAKEGLYLYPLGDGSKLVCDSCWTELTGRKYEATRYYK